eukprot:2527602-Prymnesium_polylepis.1
MVDALRHSALWSRHTGHTRSSLRLPGRLRLRSDPTAQTPPPLCRVPSPSSVSTNTWSVSRTCDSSGVQTSTAPKVAASTRTPRVWCGEYDG